MKNFNNILRSFDTQKYILWKIEFVLKMKWIHSLFWALTGKWLIFLVILTNFCLLLFQDNIFDH